MEKVVQVLTEEGKSFDLEQDDQLHKGTLSLKYSAKKANILLTAIPGQYPPLPLPTVSFVSFLVDEVAKYKNSIIGVSLSLS